MKLRDIGEPVLATENERTILRGNGGVPMVAVAITPQPGSNHFAIADEFYRRVEQIKKDMPEDLRYQIALDTTVNIRKAITEVRKLLGDETVGTTVEVSLQDNRLFTRIGAALLVTRLVDGQFPDYRQVIPSGGTRVAIVEREAFYRAVRRVSTVAAERVSLVRFGFTADRVAVTAVNPELGEASEDIAAECTGGDIELGLNARYVMDVFSAIEQEKYSSAQAFSIH